LRSRADAWWAGSSTALTGLIFAAFLAYSGVPALRHDWVWVTGSSFFSNAWSSLGGWTAIGIGSPRPYPTDYLLAIVNMVLVAGIGTYGTFLVNAFGVGAACAAGGIALTRRFTNARAAWVAAAAFAAFNPWVYNKVVAGHIHMVLAYGAAMLFLAELSKDEPSPYLVGFFALLAMQQLQFFLPMLAILAVWTLVRRTSLVPLGMTLLASMPIWIGVVSDRAYLLSIPYTQSWQADASLDPVRALELSGYFVKYADSLPQIAGGASWAVVGLAAIGAVIECIRRPFRATWLVAAALAVWLFVSGTKGLLGVAYLWTVAHVPESGLYRELYDLVAVLAIAYVVASAAAVRRIPLLQWLWLPCGLALALAWTFAPPSKFWVWARELPSYRIDAPANTRYALMPPMQPLSFEGRGSGLDPDAIVLPDNVVALNTTQFSFPETPALAQYAFTGDTRWLQALGVSRIVERPPFSTDLDSLHMQFAVPPKAFRAPGASRSLDGAPALQLEGLPRLSALPAAPWEDAVFFGDAAGVAGPGVPADWAVANAVRVVKPASGRVFATEGWVDVRTAFAVLPALAQGIGGALTTNSAAELPIDPSLATLAFVDGRLEDASGRTLTGSTHGYRWLPPLGASAVRCAGLCVIAAQSHGPPRALPSSDAGCSDTPALSSPAAWLAIADLPASGTCLLRYNVRFDQHWTAFLGGTRLGHVAVDSIVNGWVVPAHGVSQRVVIVETAACLQFVFMLFAVVAIAGVSLARGYALVKR
jgi:hypothetical protein